MARANSVKNKTKNKKVNNDNVIVEKASFTVKEETEQGEMFFKVVLAIMLIGLLGVSIFFFVDWLIKQSVEEETTRFPENNYVLTSDLELILTPGADFEGLANAALQHVLDRPGIFVEVYIYIFSENLDSIPSNQPNAKARQEGVDPIMDEIMGYAEVRTITVAGEDYEFYVFESIAIFFIDTSLEANASWTTLHNEHSGFTSTAQVPLLIKLETGGEDITWINELNGNITTTLNSILVELKSEE